MNGPEHYQQAEVLADRAWYFIHGAGEDPAVGAAMAQVAQVHATLAHVAAQASATSSAMFRMDPAWSAVIGTEGEKE